MRKIIATTLIMLAAGVSIFARDAKILDRSSKDEPRWLHEHNQDYIIAEVEAPDLTSAKNKAMDEIAQRVIAAVALNVENSASSESRYINDDGDISEKESSSFSSRIATARIPFIKGISLTEAEDIYWEKVKENKSDRIFYRLCVLYPLSQDELGKMRDEFHKNDLEKENLLKNLGDNINNVSSSSEIEQAITSLSELEEYFFDNTRRQKASGLSKSYKNLYKGLTLKTSSPSGGSFTVKIMLNGKPFEIMGLPTLKSNCASRLQATPMADNTGYEITYSDIDCLEEEDNWIEISLRLRDTRLIEKVYI